MANTSLDFFVLLSKLHFISDFNNQNKVLNAKFLKQGFRYHKLDQAFSKFYQHSELVAKFNVSLLQLSKAKQELDGDSVYSVRKTT